MNQIDDDSKTQPTDNPAPAEDPYKELPIKDFSYINDPNKVPDKPKKRHLVLIISLVVVVLAAGVFYFALHGTTSKKPNTSNSTAKSQKSSTSTAADASSVPTTSYTSAPFGLSVKYPSSWIVSADGTTSLNFTSTVVKLTADTEKVVNGKIIVSVLPKGQIPAAFGGVSGTAVLDSQRLSYTNPTSDQAAQTYISFVQYQSTTVKGGLDGVYVTGNNGYQKDQNIPATDLTGLDPLITITFQQCQTAACSNLSPLTVSAPVWSQSSFETIITNLIKSFSFN